MRKRKRWLRRGLTLLEVILAVAIFAISMVAIGELIRLGLRSAGLSRDQTTAQLLCESTLNEIVAGAILPEPVQRVPYLLANGWIYDIEVAQLDLQNLLAVRVTTRQDRPDDVPVVSFSLVRWLPDPNMVLPETPTTDEAVNEAVDESSGAATSAASGIDTGAAPSAPSGTVPSAPSGIDAGAVPSAPSGIDTGAIGGAFGP